MITVPKSLKDIKLKQLEMIADIDDDCQLSERRLKEFAILCNIDYNELYYSRDLKEVTKLINDLKWFYEIKLLDIEQNVFEFKYEDVEYVLMKEMNELTFGQFVDLDYYIVENQDNHWRLTKYIMALCSSIKGKEHSYPTNQKELQERLSIIENLSLDIVYGYTSYYLKKKVIVKELSHLYSTLSSQQVNMESSGKSTTKNGAGQRWYMTLLQAILLTFFLLIGWTYIHVYLPCRLKMSEVLLKLKLLNPLKLSTKNNKTLYNK